MTMATQSAGLLMYRNRENGIEFLLVHPGGPFFAKKDQGAWSIPKGEVEEGEDLLEAAKREFKEETNASEEGHFIELGFVKLKSGKVVHAWGFERDFDLSKFKSNTFKLEWPPKSGKIQEFPENDSAEFFPYEVAVKKLNPTQVEFLDRLIAKINP